MSGGESSPYERFVTEELQRDFEMGKSVLGRVFLGETLSSEFMDKMVLDIREPEREKGHIVPTAHYNSQTRLIHLNLEQDSLVRYASELSEKHNQSASDITRLFVGAGIARCLVANLLLPTKIREEVGGDTVETLKERLYDTESLQVDAEKFDMIHDTSLLKTVERMGDNEAGSINILRFATGMSLTYMSNVPSWQNEWAGMFQQELLEHEYGRSADLRLALTMLDADSAFKMFDDNLDHNLVAMSFPMSQAETMQFFPPSET